MQYSCQKFGGFLLAEKRAEKICFKKKKVIGRKICFLKLAVFFLEYFIGKKKGILKRVIFGSLVLREFAQPHKNIF